MRRELLMHLHLPRHHFDRKISLTLMVAIAIGIASGCGFVYPPPTIPDVVKKEVFHMGDPVALISFEPGRMSGKIVGKLNAWPFPHLEASQGIPTGNFTYVGTFKVVAKSDDDSMPAGAEGTRKVYFHEEDPHLTFADLRGYGLGQEAASDEISMSFTFKENHRILAARVISHQISARPFAYKGNKIQPPLSRDTGDTLEGEYSPDFGGYLLSSLDE
jgi:hypothetical protein